MEERRLERFLINTMRTGILCILMLCGLSNELECNQNPYIKDAGPLVETNTGTVVGKYVKVLNSDVAAFLGIPFAKLPINNNRFAKSDPIEHWEGTLFATKKPPMCMQYSSRSFAWIPSAINASEDCLYLNIWAPIHYCCSTFSKLPVLVFTHGGGFYSGSASMDIYDGSIFASNGEVIVVNINYRVGLFGFFNSGTAEAPANVGLHDQLLAFKWIKANIHRFGGDSNLITIVGESTGSISSNLHLISPLSRDLFHRAILQSGSAYHPGFVEDSNISIFKANTFAEIIGCSSNETNLKSNASEVLDCLRKKDPIELATAENQFTSKLPFFFGPTYGSICEGCNDFLPSSPIKMMNSGEFSQIPILLGINKDEGSLFLNYLMPDIFTTDKKPNLTLFQAQNLIQLLFSKSPQISPDLVFDFYFRNITEDGSEDIVKAISDAFGDFSFNCPTMYLAEKSNYAYLYWVTHRSLKDNNDEWLGVPHFYEIPYIFGKPMIDTNNFSEEDERFSGDLIRKWASFAKEGYPLTKDNKENWPKFSSSSPLAYELNPNNERSLIFPRLEACQFWRPYFTLQ